MPSAKFLLVLHAFIYIHFPVHCEPSTPAEEKNLSKLLSQTLSQTIFHRVFQLLPQTAHVRFHSRKRVHTLAFANRIAHNGTHSETGGVSDGDAIITLDTSCTFTNIPGPGVRTANFAAFGSWPGVRSRRTQRACGAAMRLCASLLRGVAAPLGCVIFFASAEVAACTPCAQCFPNVRDEGWYHYPRRALRAAETPDVRLSKGFICRFLRLGSLH